MGGGGDAKWQVPIVERVGTLFSPYMLTVAMVTFTRLHFFHSMEDKEDDKFTQSLGGRGFHVASPASDIAHIAHVGRSNSIKEKKKHKGKGEGRCVLRAGVTML